MFSTAPEFKGGIALIKRCFSLLLCFSLLVFLPWLSADAADANGWAYRTIGAATAWEMGVTGKGTKIAIIDSGVNVEDIAGGNITVMSVLGDSGEDGLGHGTMIADMVTTTAPDAEIISIKAFCGENTGEIDKIASAIALALEMGCDIINLSFGTSSDNAVLREAVSAAGAAGVLIVAASGNTGSNSACYPATYDGVLGVGVVDENKQIALFSRRNSPTRENTSIVAPGVNVYGGAYMSVLDSGSSFACAFVTGTAALLLEKSSELTAAELKMLLTNASEDLGYSGYDYVYGWGFLRADSALSQLDEGAGVPYYLDADGKQYYVGFSDAAGKFIAPEGAKLLFSQRPAETFLDVSGHWSQSSVSFAAARGLLSGVGGGRFAPETPMTRAMLVTVLGRLYEGSYAMTNEAGARGFTDCDYSSWYGKYVDWAENAGLVTGIGVGLFAPDNELTRQQLAAVVYNFAAYLNVLPEQLDKTLDYPDSENIADWARTGALYCQTTGIISGDENGCFDPGAPVTRAQAAVVLERLILQVLDSLN